MADAPDELTFEEAHAPDELTFEEAESGSKKKEMPTWGEWARQKTAAGLIGARETLPFAKDIAAATKAAVGVPGVSAPTGEFRKAKEEVEAQQEAAAKESPLAYGAGEVGAFFVPIAGQEGSLANLASKAEGAVASKLAPKIGKTAADIAGAAATGAGLGAVQGAGEGTDLGERLGSAAETGLVGGGLGAAFPLAGKVVGSVTRMTPAEEAAERIGARIPASVSSPNRITQAVSSGLSNAPITKSIMGSGVEKGIAGLGEALESTARRPGLGAEEAGKTAKEALVNWVDVDSRANVNKLYNKVSAAIDPTITTPMTNTFNAVNKIGKERLAAKLGDSEAVKLVMDAATDPQGLNYAGAQRLKREIGSKMKGIMTESNLNQEELDQLYGALRADVKEAAKNAGGAKGLAAFNRANDYAKNVIERRKELAKIIGKNADVSDKEVFSRIATMAGDTRTNTNLLKKARKSMSPSEWEDVTSGVITQLGGGQKGFSPDTFVTAYSKLTPAGKDTIFGPAGNPLRNAIEDVNTVAQRYKEVGKTRNFSNTAYGLLAAAGLGDIAYEGMSGLEHEAAIGATTVPLALLLSRPRAAQAIAAALKHKNPATLRNLKNVVQMELREHFGAPAVTSAEDREERASGGKVGKRDYPAKRLTRLERSALKAQQQIALETKPIMDQPDALVAKALELAKDR